MIKKKFGDEAEIIIEELLLKGYSTASELLLKVHERLMKNNQKVSLSGIKDIFISLVTAKYLIRLPHNDDEDRPVPRFTIDIEKLHEIPNIALSDLVAAKQKGIKKFSDKNIYWTVNFDRFHQDMRDKIIVTAFTRKFDENAGELVKFLLQQMYIRTEPWADVSNPIPIVTIKDMVKRQSTLNQLIKYFDQYVTILGKVWII